MKIPISFIFIVLVSISIISIFIQRGIRNYKTNRKKYYSEHLIIDSKSMKEGDAFSIIEPVHLIVDIYKGQKEYEKTLSTFSQSQRFVLAIFWYRMEVNNGGHHQFYFNSTGIVWKDALKGFQMIGLEDFVSIIKESTTLFGDDPSPDRRERQKQLNNIKESFEKLDEMFYDLEQKIDIDDKIFEYMRKRPEDFYFNGKVKKVNPNYNNNTA